MDSFYEYLLKAYILFGDEDYLDKWVQVYESMLTHAKAGGDSCGADADAGEGYPLFINVNMDRGGRQPSSVWIDSLQAAFPGVQLLAGHLEDAICLHNVYASLWQTYGALPERFDWLHNKVNIPLYPLRPELAESTYLLYRATKNAFYLWVGKWMVEGIERLSRSQCGYATVHSVLDGSLEDRMESFFLSETLKYLFLLFDEDNPVNLLSERILFTTEGHIIPLLARFQQSIDSLNNSAHNRTKSTSGGNVLSCSVPVDPFLLRSALPLREIVWKSPDENMSSSCSVSA